MADIRIPKLDDKVKKQLKAMAAAAGIPLYTYCATILAAHVKSGGKR